MGSDFSTWFGAIPALFASAVILLLPGLTIGLCIRLRGLWLVALAPATSMTVLGLASTVLPFLNLSWTPISVSAFALVFGALVFLLFRILGAQHSAASPRLKWPDAVALLIGGLPLGIYAILGIGAVENISQTFDNIFHLNAIAEITSSGSASPLTVAAFLAPEGDSSFYPDAWHAAAQLVAQSSGVTTAAAINSFNVVALMTAWPAGMILFVRQLVGRSTVVTLGTGILLAGFPAAPMALLYYGVLYPYFLGVVLVPAILALLLNLLGVSREERVFGILALAILLAGTLPGIALTHPGAMMLVLAFSVPVVFISALGGWRSASTASRVTRVASLTLFLCIGLIMLQVLRPGVVWGPRLSLTRALWETITLSLGSYGLPVAAAALMLVGLIVALRNLDKTNLAAVLMWFVGATLFFVTAGVSNDLLRAPTGVWYADTPRLAAAYPIVAIPLAVGAFAYLVKIASLKLGRPKIIAGISLGLLLVITHLTAGYNRLIPSMFHSYTYSDSAALLSTEEMQILSELRNFVPEDEAIVGNPWTGTSLAYAIAGREVILPHVFMKEITEDQELLLSSFRYATPAVCEAADRLGVRWVLDFGEREVHGGRNPYPGIEGLENSNAFTLEKRIGEASLYHLTGCNG